MAPQYHETLFSQLYPGKQQSSPTYLPLVEALDSCLAFDAEQKARTILRTDAGFWNDANVNTVLRKGWQVMSKSSGGRRPLALARQVSPDRWIEVRPNDRWVAEVVAPVCFCRPVQWLALRWRNASGELKHSAVVCSVPGWSPREVIARYDD
ncbi:MAG TPA: hypothetical protein VFX76_13425, partial [Roseiflexaceae bacterium]|nr:hypothetical protein [Roseiflexaceae bacterium]